VSDPGAPCEVHVLVPRLSGGEVLVRDGSGARPALPVVRLPGEAGERPGSIFDGVRSSTGFDGLLGMSGFYDLEPDYLKGYRDDNCYFNNPAWYLRDIAGPALDVLRTACRIILVSGRGAYEAPAASQQLSDLLRAKDIPHVMDFWGEDVNHDWPWWRRMLPHYLDRL